MQFLKHIYFILAIAILFTACERTISLKVNKQSSKLVVDASIENNGTPKVALSTSLNYFSTISAEKLEASFVHDAIVTVSDGSKTITLKENSYTDTSGYTVYSYITDPSDPAQTLTGELNTTYKLKIELPDSSVYTATTTIPSMRKTCDSLWWKKAPDNPDTALCVLYGLFTDPEGLGDYVRYFVSTNSQPFYPGYTSVFDDQVTDGTTYTFQIPKSYNSSDSASFNDDDYGFFHRGDSIIFKFCDIDKATYDFWRTWEYAYQSNGNPFSSPITVTGNISGDALGVFCGYAAQYRSIIIPK
ncbi:DUF4249 domain-containing protein [Parafilimonas sp.]|uniref:DUF4249 domain-containing protein n=1 Tax=Parafilimonas sp. TaxID=1969739 RepID=UPI0039E6DCB0